MILEIIVSLARLFFVSLAKDMWSLVRVTASAVYILGWMAVVSVLNVFNRR